MTASPTFPYRTTWSAAQPLKRPVTTSRSELIQIAGAYAVLSFDLVILLSGGGLLFGSGTVGVFSSISLQLLLVATAAAFTGFVAHEIAHKVWAQRHGYWAEFRWSPMGLVFSVFTAFLGFLFAAPGATIVSGMDNVAEWGRTSLAGPMTNVAFGAAFYAGALLAWHRADGLVVSLLFLAYINAFWATFNMIPLGPLDGRKVIRWNAGVWIIGTALPAALGVFSYLALSSGNPVLHL